MAHREEVEATLEAASSDPEVASLTRRGRLVTAVPRPAGFAGLLDLPLGQAAARPRPAPTAGPEGGHGLRPDDDLEQAREAVRRREQAAAEAATEAERARAAADEAVAAVARRETELAEARALAPRSRPGWPGSAGRRRVATPMPPSGAWTGAVPARPGHEPVHRPGDGQPFSSSDRMLPAGSLNQAMRGPSPPPPAIPRSSVLTSPSV